MMRATSVSLLLVLGVQMLHAQPQTTYTFKEVRDEQRVLLEYIRQAQTEFQNGIVRHRGNGPLWQNNIMKADLELKVAFALMDGNVELAPHQAKIGNLKKLFHEAYWVHNFTTNYLEIRNQGSALQSKIDPLVAQFDAGLKGWLDRALDQIRDSDNPKQTSVAFIQQTSGASLPPTSGIPLTVVRVSIGNGYSYDHRTGAVFETDGKAISTATWDGSRIHLSSGITYDPKTGIVTGAGGEPIPGAKFVNGNLVGPEGNPIAGTGGLGAPGAPGAGGAGPKPGDAAITGAIR